jgi:hypothetical protein
LVNVAENGLGREVASADLTHTRHDDIARVDLDEGVGDGTYGAIRCRATVPVLGPPLGDVLEVAGLLVILGADDGHDALVIGHATRAVGAVREELRVECEGAERHDLGEGEVVDIGIVGFAEGGAECVVLSQNVHGELLARVRSRELDHLYDETR